MAWDPAPPPPSPRAGGVSAGRGVAARCRGHRAAHPVVGERRPAGGVWPVHGRAPCRAAGGNAARQVLVALRGATTSRAKTVRRSPSGQRGERHLRPRAGEPRPGQPGKVAAIPRPYGVCADASRRRVVEDDWPRLRAIRLEMLTTPDVPRAGATRARTEAEWRFRTNEALRPTDRAWKQRTRTSRPVGRLLACFVGRPGRDTCERVRRAEPAGHRSRRAMLDGVTDWARGEAA